MRVHTPRRSQSRDSPRRPAPTATHSPFRSAVMAVAAVQRFRARRQHRRAAEHDSPLRRLSPLSLSSLSRPHSSTSQVGQGYTSLTRSRAVALYARHSSTQPLFSVSLRQYPSHKTLGRWFWNPGEQYAPKRRQTLRARSPPQRHKHKQTARGRTTYLSSSSHLSDAP